MIVVDDQSADETTAIVESFAARDPRIGLFSAPSLPPGWCGKPHACAIGARAAPSDVEWLCFIDADVRANALLLASAVRTARAEGLDFLSLSPRQELGSFAERLVMPCGFYLLAFQQDLAKIDALGSGDARATGQFILIRRAAYDAVGGHAAVGAEVCEDLELARLVKRSGFRVGFRGGDQLLSTRMYLGWSSLWPGVSKNLVDMLDGPAVTASVALVGVAMAWAAVLVPLFDVWVCGARWNATCLPAIALALPASLAAFAFHLFGAGFFRIPLAYGLLFPVGYTIGALIAFDSLRLRLTGRVAWKGRRYPVGKARTAAVLRDPS